MWHQAAAFFVRRRTEREILKSLAYHSRCWRTRNRNDPRDAVRSCRLILVPTYIQRISAISSSNRSATPAHLTACERERGGGRRRLGTWPLQPQVLEPAFSLISVLATWLLAVCLLCLHDHPSLSLLFSSPPFLVPGSKCVCVMPATFCSNLTKSAKNQWRTPFRSDLE